MSETSDSEEFYDADEQTPVRAPKWVFHVFKRFKIPVNKVL